MTRRTSHLITRRVMAFAFVAAAMSAAPHNSGPRVAEMNPSRDSSPDRATPILITCDGLDWQIYGPGTVPIVAASVCPPGATYLWKAMP